jgi:hypothetical protein
MKIKNHKQIILRPRFLGHSMDIWHVTSTLLTYLLNTGINAATRVDGSTNYSKDSIK